MFATQRHDGVDASLVRFPEAGHGFGRLAKPSMRIRRQGAIAAWIDR